MIKSTNSEEDFDVHCKSPPSKMHGVTLGTKKMSGDFDTQLQGLHPFNHGIFVRNREFIQFVTWLKKDFQDWMKID